MLSEKYVTRLMDFAANSMCLSETTYLGNVKASRYFTFLMFPLAVTNLSVSYPFIADKKTLETWSWLFYGVML